MLGDTDDHRLSMSSTSGITSDGIVIVFFRGSRFSSVHVERRVVRGEASRYYGATLTLLFGTSRV